MAEYIQSYKRATMDKEVLMMPKEELANYLTLLNQ